MGSEWENAHLKDLTVKIGSGSTPKGGSSSYKKEGISLIRSQNVYDLNFSRNGLAFIDEIQAQKLANVEIDFGDILLNITGDSVARVCQVPDAIIPARVNQHVAVIRPKEELLDSTYLLYYLVSQTNKNYLLSLASAGATRNALTKAMIENLEISYPPLPEQKAIAHILGTLDDKIELNCKMNETLEEMAQALFKSWFVDFDPVLDKALAAGHEIPEPLKVNAEKRKALGDNRKSLPQEIVDLFPDRFVFTEELGWVPEGWEVKYLEDIASVKYGKDHKKLEEGSYPCYGSGGVMRYVESTLYDSPSVLIPRKGSLDNIMYVREPFWSVDTMFYTAFNKESYVKFLYYNLKLLDFSGMNVGSAVPSMTTKVLNGLKILKPHDSILLKFDQILEIYYKKIEANKNQIEELTTCRDTLLPKLISGELRVIEDEEKTQVELEKKHNGINH